MSVLLKMELSKLWRLTSVRFGLLVLVLFPVLWAYAPGIFEVYGFFLVSGYQVPALGLLSSMQFLLPLLTARACLAPVNLATSASKSLAFQWPLRWASWLYRKSTPVSRTSITSLRSSSPKSSVPGMI